MYQSILLPVDLSQESSWRKALPAAVNMCREQNAKLHVMTVIPNYGSALVGSFFPSDFVEKALQATEVELEKFVAEHVPSDLSAGSTAVSGTIYKRILAVADKQGCDLIIVASHRPETKDYLLGPNAARVVRHANQSVLVVRD